VSRGALTWVRKRIRDLLHWGPADLDDGGGTRRFFSPRSGAAGRCATWLTIEEGKRYLGIMPAVAGDAMGAKLVSFYPGNAGLYI